MPLVVYILGITIFSITTSEFMIAGMMPSLTQAFGVSITHIGYLISIYASGMVVGGPLLTVLLLKLKLPHKRSLLILLVIYALAQSVAASAVQYNVMAIARLITGMSAAACFGVSLAICADLVSKESIGRAASVVVGGLMLATVIGVPIATLIDQHIGWRASFWLVVILTLICALIIMFLIPSTKESVTVSLKTELSSFKNPHLWAAYGTSGLIIGATFTAFSYFAIILTKESGFSIAAIPWLLGLYGLANVVGNTFIGRYADKFTMSIMVCGLIILSITLMLFAIYAQIQSISLILLILIGLTGVPMNPAMITRVMKTVHPGPLVNTVHTSVINVGLGVGAWIGGMALAEGYGVRSPLWIGSILAILGLLSLLPYVLNKRQLA